jgi:predicted PurR-regulated permease PerM
MLYLLFFFLRDGHAVVERLVRILPLGDARERHLFNRFAEVVRATVKGTFVIAAVQGTIGGIAFALLGVRGALLWGVVMALSSLLPVVGPALVWAPAAVLLMTTDRLIEGIVLVVVGVVLVGLADNLLRPILVGRDTRMPDYLVLLATLGGLALFGISGLVIGPLIAALFITLWEMFEQTYGDREAERAAAEHSAEGADDAPPPAP